MNRFLLFLILISLYSSNNNNNKEKLFPFSSLNKKANLKVPLIENKSIYSLLPHKKFNQKISLKKSNKINAKIPTIEDKSIEELIPKTNDKKIKSIEANSQNILQPESQDKSNSSQKVTKIEKKLSNAPNEPLNNPEKPINDQSKLIEQKIKLKLTNNNPLKINDHADINKTNKDEIVEHIHQEEMSKSSEEEDDSKYKIYTALTSKLYVKENGMDIEDVHAGVQEVGRNQRREFEFKFYGPEKQTTEPNVILWANFFKISDEILERKLMVYSDDGYLVTPIFNQIISVFAIQGFLQYSKLNLTLTVDNRKPENLDKITLLFPIKTGMLLGASMMLKEQVDTNGHFSGQMNTFIDSYALGINYILAYIHGLQALRSFMILPIGMSLFGTGIMGQFSKNPEFNDSKMVKAYSLNSKLKFRINFSPNAVSEGGNTPASAAAPAPAAASAPAAAAASASAAAPTTEAVSASAAAPTTEAAPAAPVEQKPSAEDLFGSQKRDIFRFKTKLNPEINDSQSFIKNEIKNIIYGKGDLSPLELKQLEYRYFLILIRCISIIIEFYAQFNVQQAFSYRNMEIVQWLFISKVSQLLTILSIGYIIFNTMIDEDIDSIISKWSNRFNIYNYGFYSNDLKVQRLSQIAQAKAITMNINQYYKMKVVREGIYRYDRQTCISYAFITLITMSSFMESQAIPMDVFNLIGVFFIIVSQYIFMKDITLTIKDKKQKLI